MNRRTAIALVVVCCVGICAVVLAQGNPDKLEGWKPYTPTRLGWLGVELNASSRTQLTEINGFLLSFVPHEKTDSIIIYVRYMRTANREAMNLTVESAREVIKIRAEAHGWDSWLKVREDIKMANY